MALAHLQTIQLLLLQEVRLYIACNLTTVLMWNTCHYDEGYLMISINSIASTIFYLLMRIYWCSAWVDNILAGIVLTEFSWNILPFQCILDIIVALKRQCDARWRIFGTHLGVSSPIMDTIHKDSTGKSTDCMLALLDIWLLEETGTGELPRCWKCWKQCTLIDYLAI